MSSQTLSSYFSGVDALARTLERNPGATRALLHLIEQYKDEAAGDRAKDEFFKGEYAFYSGQYERALKHYLEAKSVEDFEFFCYRASAYVSQAQGNLEKAIKFAEKARAVFQDDYATLSLLRKLFEQAGRQEEAALIAQHLHALQPIEEDSAADAPPMTIGANEIKELAGIFEPHAVDQLFVEEILAAPSSHGAVEAPFFAPVASFDARIAASCGRGVTDRTTVVAEGLEGSIRAFQTYQSELLEDYIQTWKARPPLADHCLYVFQGWHQQPASMHDLSKVSPDSMPFWLTETLRKSSGGFYLRWNGKGIAINPGRYFIRELHRQGLHVKDIDYVIATHDHPDSYADVKEIWELNSRLNSATGGMQVVHYYLNQNAYQALSATLKPHFKQERDAIHCLELFIDSPEVEHIELEPGIKLHYFSASNYGGMAAAARARDKFNLLPLTLGIRLELVQPSESCDEGRPVNVGYISEMAWSPLLGHHLGPCDVLVAGFGNTSVADYTKSAHEEDALGYFGTYALLEEVDPRLFLCSEFGGREGDIRLDIVRRLRSQLAQAHPSKARQPVILPADTGLFIDLESLRVKCSTSSAMIDPAEVRVTNPTGAFGRLCYLAPDCCL